MKGNVLYIISNWGAGHFTRSLPILKSLIKSGLRVYALSSPVIIRRFKKRIPEVQLFAIPELFPEVRYHSNIFLSLLWNSLRMYVRFKYNSELLKEICKRYGISTVISDGVVGLSRVADFQVLINHQLSFVSGNIAIPYPLRVFGEFDEIWVPDIEDRNGLSGLLGHPPGKKSKKVKYTGPVSRFKIPEWTQKNTEKNKIVIFISGPSPFPENLLKFLLKNTASIPCEEITVFSHVLPEKGIVKVKELKRYDEFFVIYELEKRDKMVKIVTGASDEFILAEVESACLIMASGGYSTIMDIACFPLPRILFPLSGQMEQTYLAKHLMERNFSLSLNIDDYEMVFGKEWWYEKLNKAREITIWHPSFVKGEIEFTEA